MFGRKPIGLGYRCHVAGPDRYLGRRRGATGLQLQGHNSSDFPPGVTLTRRRGDGSVRSTLHVAAEDDGWTRRLEEWETSDPERADEIVCYSDEQYQTHFTVLLAQLQRTRILDEQSLRPCALTSEGSGMIGATVSSRTHPLKRIFSSL